MFESLEWVLPDFLSGVSVEIKNLGARSRDECETSLPFGFSCRILSTELLLSRRD